jgi:hypothetical protein
MAAGGVASGSNVVAYSSIFANNRVTQDVSSGSPTHADLALLNNSVLSGAHNLVISTNAVPSVGVITVTRDLQTTHWAITESQRIQNFCIRARVACL